MRPRTKEFATGPAKIPNLPPNKTALDVLSDYLKYLNDCAKQWIKETHPGIGTSIWEGPEIHYILSHPNGWEGPQQAVMKQAANKAGLVTPEGRNKITFITEGEASLNHCIEKGLMNESIQVSRQFDLLELYQLILYNSERRRCLHCRCRRRDARSERVRSKPGWEDL